MLGAHQDAVVGEEVLRRLAPELPGAALAMGRLVDRERARRAEARAAWQAAWRELRAARQGARRVTLVVVRHGSAGDRDEWDDDDRLRPLDKKGRKQAARLVDVLAGSRIERIVSSPYLRCVQTVEPLARARGARDRGGRRAGRAPVLRRPRLPRRAAARTTTPSRASTAGSSARSGSTCASARAPSGASWTRSSGPRSWSRGALRRAARGEQPRRRALAQAARAELERRRRGTASARGG